MIEFFNCSYLILFFLFLFRLNLSEILIEKFLLKKKLNLLDIYSFNLLFVTFIILIISFTKISQLAVIYLLFFISIISLVIKSKNIVISKLNFDFILIFIFTFIISTELIFDPKLGWDGHFWYFKALNFFEGLNFFNLTNDRSAPHYPHLGGALWGITWKISLLNYEYFGRIIFIFIYVLSILIVANKISENIKIKTLYSIILFFLTFDQLLINGYQDYILFSFIIIIFNFLDKINLKKIDYYQCVFIILSSYILAWLKNEGFFYFLFINIFLCYFLSFKKKIFLISIVFLLIFIKLSLFNKIDENFDLLKIIFSNNLNLTNFSLIELINKVYFITLHILISFFKYPLWLLFFISFFLKKLKKNEIYILYFGIVSILFIFGPFLISKSDLYWHVTGALDRISIQLLGFFIIFIAYRIKYFNKKFLGMK